uniref:Uncharacterized protein n=1 Tax=Anguilla anguilla TaxID=7936 RepID=A0A0E9S0J2_ANGAN
MAGCLHLWWRTCSLPAFLGTESQSVHARMEEQKAFPQCIKLRGQ